MNIVQLVENFGIGGLPNYVLSLSALLSEKGHKVTVAYIRGPVGDYLETKDLRLVHAPTPEILKNLNPDIIHMHLLSDLDYLNGLKTLNVPLIRSFHDYTSTCLRRGKRRWPGDRCKRPLNLSCAAFGCLIGRDPAGKSRLPHLMDLPGKINERNFYRDIEGAICGSHHMKDMLLNNGFSPEKTHRIPYFSKFESQAACPALKKPGAGKTRPFELLFSGQAVSGKGLEILIAALEGFEETSWNLTVFSEGPRLNAAKALAEEKGLSTRISFKGWVAQSELLAAYGKADLFILPSIWDDPGPLVGIEALACGTPVLGFAVGGIPDYILDGETGFLVPDVSSQGLHEGLKRAFETEENLAGFSEKCQALVIENHTAKRHSAEMIEIYEKIIRQEEQTI